MLAHNGCERVGVCTGMLRARAPARVALWLVFSVCMPLGVSSPQAAVPHLGGGGPLGREEAACERLGVPNRNPVHQVALVGEGVVQRL